MQITARARFTWIWFDFRKEAVVAAPGRQDELCIREFGGLKEKVKLPSLYKPGNSKLLLYRTGSYRGFSATLPGYVEIGSWLVDNSPHNKLLPGATQL